MTSSASNPVPSGNHGGSECSATQIGCNAAADPSNAESGSGQTLPADSGIPVARELVLSVGACVNRFELCEVLGKGSFGEVWKCRDPLLDRFVAIKFPWHKPGTPRIMTGLIDEARKVSRLSHPCIVHIYDVIESADHVAIVSELIDGQTLRERLSAGRIAVGEAVAVIRDVASGLQHAHQHDLVHRDVKPGNILIRRTGPAALTDFGLAASEPQIGQMKDPSSGTLYFMSPEQARGDISMLDNRSDIFCLGVVLFYCLTGRYPYPAATDTRTYMRSVATRNAKSLRAVDSQLPKVLDQICARCLARDPRDRYRTAQDLVDDLNAFLNDETAPLSSPPARMLPRWVAAALVLTGLLVVVGISTTVWQLSGGAATAPQNSSATVTSQARINEVNLIRYPEIFAWPYTNDRGTPQHSPETETLSVTTPTSRLVAVCGRTDHPELNLQVQLKLNNWIGAAGLFWGLRQNPDAPTSIEYLCYSAEFLRTSADSNPVVCVSELTLKPLDQREMQIPNRREIATVDVPIPTEAWTTLKVSVTAGRLNVFLDNQEVCKPVDVLYPEKSWLPPMNGQQDSAMAGIIGQSSLVAFRKLECF